MIYFKFLINTDTDIIGHYPQTKLSDNYNPSLPNSHWNLKRNEFPKFDLNYQLELNYNAKPTSFLDGASSPSGLIVNENLKLFLNDFNLPPHKFHKIEVRHKNNFINYYLLQIITRDIWQYIDVEKSTLKISNSINSHNFVTAPVISKLYVEKLNKYYLKDFNQNLLPNEIYFKDNFPLYDIISIDSLVEEMIFSSRLKKSLENNNLSDGSEFKILRYLK
jgi:hypothetical protein